MDKQTVAGAIGSILTEAGITDIVFVYTHKDHGTKMFMQQITLPGFEHNPHMPVLYEYLVKGLPAVDEPEK